MKGAEDRKRNGERSGKPTAHPPRRDHERGRHGIGKTPARRGASGRHTETSRLWQLRRVARRALLLEAEGRQFAIDVLDYQNAIGDHGLAPQRLAAGPLARSQFAVIEL